MLPLPTRPFVSPLGYLGFQSPAGPFTKSCLGNGKGPFSGPWKLSSSTCRFSARCRKQPVLGYRNMFWWKNLSHEYPFLQVMAPSGYIVKGSRSLARGVDFLQAGWCWPIMAAGFSRHRVKVQVLVEQPCQCRRWQNEIKSAAGTLLAAAVQCFLPPISNFRVACQKQQLIRV